MNERGTYQQSRPPGNYSSAPRRDVGSTGSASAPLDTSKIKFSPINADLFDGVAKSVAKSLAEDTRTNKPTQLRRFYDEICMWNATVEANEERFDEFLPFIRMLNAKTAYAMGRNKLVDEKFVELMRHGLSQVKDPKTMKYFKLFMEAVMGFYKELRPKDS